MEMLYFIGTLGWLFSALKWANWKNILRFSSSIYFMMLGSLLYEYLNPDRKLWQFESPYFNIPHPVINLVITFVAFPCSILLFLSHYPSEGTMTKKLIYNTCWVAIYSILEWISYLLGIFTYHYGWNLGWSILINSIMFPILWLNQKRTVLAYFLSFAVTVFFFLKFGLSMETLK